MKSLFPLLLAVVLLSGCGSGVFQVPKQEYQAKVQVLGVLPLLVDHQAAIDYPQKEALFDLLERSNSGKHEVLVARLKDKKGYFDVRTLSGDPNLLELSLLGAKKPADRFGRPQGYNYNAADIGELARRNVVDALLVVVFAGAQVDETRRSRSMLETLKTTYDDIRVTAAVIGRDGQVLWKLASDDSYQFLTLQYPDFDEAYYNRTDLVKLKFIQLSGLEREVDEKADSNGRVKLPEPYNQLFNQIASGISPGLLDTLH